MWSIIVHGGAGAILDALETEHVQGCRAAVAAGVQALEHGADALDVVQCAVRVLEDNPVFNAGTGGALDERGWMVADAAVMRGSDLAYGAIASVVGLKNPIDLARAVLDDGRHCLLVGPPALDFARQRGVTVADPSLFITERSRAEREKRLSAMASAVSTSAAPRAGISPFHAEFEDPSEHPVIDTNGVYANGVDMNGDTVGAVAIDVHGCLAAATSTGGLSAKRAGRVGDSPVAGAGTYACEFGALSATGHGETMLRTVFAHRALSALRGSAEDPATLLRRELDWAAARVGGKGGAIVVLPSGAPIYARNTRHMGVAWQTSESAMMSDF